MACNDHSWWFDTPCPKCVVTAPVTSTSGEPVLPEEDDDLGIPEFLVVANRDKPFSATSALLPSATLAPVVEETPRDVREWTDEELMAATSDAALTTRDRQPIFRELHRREDKRKAHARIEKLKESKRRE